MGRALLLGYGSIGRYHAKLLSRRFEDLAIVDINGKVCAAARTDFPAALVARELSELDSLAWDWDDTLAVIATWGPSHASFYDSLVRRGVRRILCEKPLAHSIWDGAEMVATADKLGVVLGTHHHLRYSGFITGLKELAKKLGIGDPAAVFIHGGASGLVTNGIHYIDMACELFGKKPTKVVSNAIGEPINPRSPDLLFYAGTAAWSFDDGEEATICFTNRSSVAPTILIYFRDAVAEVDGNLGNLDVTVRHRDAGELQRYPVVTRLGKPREVIYQGRISGVRSVEERTLMMLDEIASGAVRVFPPALAFQALESCIGALASGLKRRAIAFPIALGSGIARAKWPIS